MEDHRYYPRIIRLGLPDRFVEHGTVTELYRITGLDAEGICHAISEIIR